MVPPPASRPKAYPGQPCPVVVIPHCSRTDAQLPSVPSVVVFFAACEEEPLVVRWLPWDSNLGNLAPFSHLTHTRFTYHRTWETGLGVEIRVATVSPDFLPLLP